MRRLAAAGAVVVLFGFAVAFQRGLAGFFDPSYAVVTLVGALALVQGLRYTAGRRRVDLLAVDFGEPERRFELPAPGDDLDRRLRASAGFSSGRSSYRTRILDELRAVAAETLVARGDCDPREARKRVAEGTWTDDEVAAALLADGASVPIRARLSALARRESAFRFAARRTAAALAAVREDPQ